MNLGTVIDISNRYLEYLLNFQDFCTGIFWSSVICFRGVFVNFKIAGNESWIFDFGWAVFFVKSYIYRP